VATVLWIFVTVDVKLLIRRSFDTLTIIGPAKTGPAGPLPTAMIEPQPILFLIFGRLAEFYGDFHLVEVFGGFSACD